MFKSAPPSQTPSTHTHTGFWRAGACILAGLQVLILLLLRLRSSNAARVSPRDEANQEHDMEAAPGIPRRLLMSQSGRIRLQSSASQTLVHPQGNAQADANASIAFRCAGRWCSVSAHGQEGWGGPPPSCLCALGFCPGTLPLRPCGRRCA